MIVTTPSSFAFNYKAILRIDSAHLDSHMLWENICDRRAVYIISKSGWTSSWKFVYGKAWPSKKGSIELLVLLFPEEQDEQSTMFLLWKTQVSTMFSVERIRLFRRPESSKVSPKPNFHLDNQVDFYFCQGSLKHVTCYVTFTFANGVDSHENSRLNLDLIDWALLCYVRDRRTSSDVNIHRWYWAMLYSQPLSYLLLFS